MSIQDVLTAYEGLQSGYARVAELKERAGRFPDLYTEADELEADLNESARGLLDQVRELLPDGKVWTVVVETAHGDSIEIEALRSEAEAYATLSIWYPVDGLFSNSELVEEIETTYGHSVYVNEHEI